MGTECRMTATLLTYTCSNQLVTRMKLKLSTTDRIALSTSLFFKKSISLWCRCCSNIVPYSSLLKFGSHLSNLLPQPLEHTPITTRCSYVETDKTFTIRLVTTIKDGFGKLKPRIYTFLRIIHIYYGGFHRTITEAKKEILAKFCILFNCCSG